MKWIQSNFQKHVNQRTVSLGGIPKRTCQVMWNPRRRWEPKTMMRQHGCLMFLPYFSVKLVNWYTVLQFLIIAYHWITLDNHGQDFESSFCELLIHPCLSKAGPVGLQRDAVFFFRTDWKTERSALGQKVLQSWLFKLTATFVSLFIVTKRFLWLFFLLERESWLLPWPKLIQYLRTLLQV